MADGCEDNCGCEEFSHVKRRGRLAGDGMRGIDNIGFFGNNSYECIL